MKHFVGIPLFLLALPMVAAETPMSYVRVIEFDPLAPSYAYCASVGIYPNDDTKYPQPPSSADIKYAGDGANYCFGMGDGRVYIYDRAGVQAIVPLNDFVMPKIITK